VSNLWVQARDALAALLDPAERDAVLGDLAELALTDPQVVKSLAGLLVRRQLKVWKDRRSWLVLVAIIISVCPLLASICAGLTMGIWPSLWMNLHHGISYRTGLSSAALLSGFCFRAVALITWSLACGLALGALSRRALWATGALFFGLYVDQEWFFADGSRLNAWAWLPLLINCIVVLLPTFCGIRQSSRFLKTNFPWMVLLALWTITIGGLALWTQGWNEVALDNWSRGGSALTLSQLARYGDAWNAKTDQVLATAVLTLPILYLLAQSALVRRRRTTE
jgi:hypothetical protein